MKLDYIVGIDWGGTRIKMGAVTRDGSFLAHDKNNYPKNGDVGAKINLLISGAEQLIAKIGYQPCGIGLGLTGPVNPDFGVVLLPGKINGLEKYPTVEKFRQHFGVPVRAENDGILSMYAEKFAGNAKNVSWAVTVTLGTGVGSGVMLDGCILKDPHFMFGGQLGHLVLNTADDRLCLTGARGAGEMYCSATALISRVHNAILRGIPSVLSDRFFTDAHAINFQTIIDEGVAKGDPLCCDELKCWTRDLGWLLVNAVHAYSPEIIILSGGATLAAGYFLAELQQHVNEHIFRYPPGQGVPIVVSEIAEHAGVLGAAMMLFEHLKNSHD